MKTHISSLKEFNTFGIDVLANNFNKAKNEDEILHFLIENKCNPLILGGGSNILFKNNINKPILKIEIKGIQIIEENENSIYVSVGAGENWNDFVRWSLAKNYGGIENLSLIPGNVGSAPIQNIGAYGAELKDVFHSCRAISIDNKIIKTFIKDECNFTYRSSIFKEKLKNKYVISRVTFRLSKTNHVINSEYKPLKNLLNERGIITPTIQDISKLVIEIRTNKLPDPKKIGNCGSFFKNPIISNLKFKNLFKKFNTIPNYKISKNEVKIPAAWLIEECGFKGKIEGKTGTHKKHALVIVNNGGASGEEIYKFSQNIKKSVLKKFNILLEEEVNIFE
ncbi:UDP-N-acetylmuramate dehydrogenase [Flavobacteriaceae bacterium]|nr:UDP-N-acetylmuramate dehydrogenase [Flavobacteriaceae bacterium]MDB2427206.1 UDP-N-acetylmuramate dehydrogenase [Flavobacteriaceae bacterium]MDB2567147.1 UDP-N-acetylmuramate dehydrogenase [Flavobacteriaceae bacterium]MDB2567878.1 UDP-N-acetylmuramate dehydrogenase [Flavobacteriaceae bacterium]MDB9847252.1 UDP-N-acetylmuramate dehydrogenase [Flavobacteriaceae bacterium]